MRVLVLLSDDLVAARIAGRSIVDHWAFLGRLVGVTTERARPDAVANASPVLLIDGRYAGLSAESLGAIASRGDAGTLLSSAGDVIAALVVDTPDAQLSARLRAVSAVAAVVSRAEGVRIDEAAGDVEATVRRSWLDRLAARGVRFVDPARTIVDTTVDIAAGVVVWPDAVLRGATLIAAGAEIQQGAWLEDTSVGEGALVRPYTVCTGADIGPAAQVGPFAHLRNGAVLEADTKVGNFVEVKEATLRRGAKASHLTYLGDADIGADANIGAGTITCNYDGFGKYRTTIGAGAFVGSNSSLVAPVSVGAGAIVGAGSVVTQDVPAEALFIERAVPKLFEGQAPHLRERNKKRADTAK